MQRGVRLSEGAAHVRLDVVAFKENGELYGALKASAPTSDPEGPFAYNSEVSALVGRAFDVKTWGYLDVGIEGYWRPDDEPTGLLWDEDRAEVFAGVMTTLPFQPGVYVSYDTEVEAITVDVAAGGDRLLAANTSVDWEVRTGAVSATDSGFENYTYYGASANLRVSPPRSAWSVYGGVRATGSNEPTLFTDNAAVTGAPAEFERALYWAGIGIKLAR